MGRAVSLRNKTKQKKHLLPTNLDFFFPLLVFEIRIKSLTADQ